MCEHFEQIAATVASQGRHVKMCLKMILKYSFNRSSMQNTLFYKITHTEMEGFYCTVHFKLVLNLFFPQHCYYMLCMLSFEH